MKQQVLQELASTRPELFTNLERLELKEDTLFQVWNEEDDIPATQLLSLNSAIKAMEVFPMRYMHQGYYLNNNQEKLNPLEVKLRLELKS